MTDTPASASPGFLELDWQGQPQRWPLAWLRDCCPCPQCRHPSGQRLQMEVFPELSARGELLAGDRLQVSWSDGHESTYELSGLGRFAEPPPAPVLWNAESLEFPEFDYHELLDHASVRREGLTRFFESGLLLLKNAPTAPGTLLEFVARLGGFVRETNYGKYYEVQVAENVSNLANTALPLEAHTDNPYRNPVPTVQCLHCLINETGGGDSMLVDGFHAAEDLRRTAPEQFRELTQRSVPFQYLDESCDLRNTVPLIDLAPEGGVQVVHYNRRSMRPQWMPPHQLESFYAALSSLRERLHAPANTFTFHLEPGDLLMFSNRRILHGRTAFSHSGARHLQGCYPDVDGLLSSWRRAA